MLPYDVPTDVEAYSCPFFLGFGCEERLKNIGLDIFRYAGAVIYNTDLYLVSFLKGLQNQLALVVHGLEGIGD